MTCSDYMGNTGSDTVSVVVPTPGSCASGFNLSGAPLAILDDDNTAASPGGMFKISKFGNYCFGNTSNKNYYVPMKTRAEFESFWNNIEQGRFLEGLYRIP